jgi:hypothetical protein
MGYKFNPFTGGFDRVEDTGAAAPDIEFITGNTGGPVGPDSNQNINFTGTGHILVTGTPGTSSLVISDNGTVTTQYDADSGSAVPSSNVLNVLGTAAQGISSTGAGNTLTFTNADASTTQKGVLETSTEAESIAGSSSTVAVVPSSLAAKLGAQTSFTVPYGNTTSGAISWTSAGTNGQLVIAATGAAPAFATVTSSDSSITITGGANTLDLVTGAAIADTYTTDAGDAIPALGIIKILGGTGCATAGATNVVTINLDASVPLSFPTDSGTATPAANALSILGTGGISTSGAGSTVTIDGTAISDFDWNDVTGTSASAAVNNGYSANNAGLVTVTLPTTAVFGSVVRVAGQGAGGWLIAQNAGETVHFGSTDSTTGVGGSLASTNRYDAVELLCTVADTEWVVLSSVGNITIV